MTFNIDWPGADTERSSLMPSTRLTASSSTSEIWLSTSSTEPPGSVVRTMTFGRSTDGEAIDAEPHERRGADDDERHDQHRREDRAPDADGGECAHDGLLGDA